MSQIFTILYQKYREKPIGDDFILSTSGSLLGNASSPEKKQEMIIKFLSQFGDIKQIVTDRIFNEDIQLLEWELEIAELTSPSISYFSFFIIPNNIDEDYWG